MALITTTFQKIGSGINYLTNISNNHPYINGAIHLGLVAYAASYGESNLGMAGYTVTSHLGLVVSRIALSTIGLALNPPAPAMVSVECSG